MEKLSIRPRDVVVREFVDEWLAKAEADLAGARVLLQEGERFADMAGFHAQQAAEKFLKAYLTRRQIEFPKTHLLEELLSLVATADKALALRLRKVSALNPYAVEWRYPPGTGGRGADAAREAIGLAEEVRSAILAAISGHP